MKKYKAFTLIELLVVITIIGILAVGGIQVYSSQIKKARDSNRIRDINILNSGMVQYVLDNGIHVRGQVNGSLGENSTNISNFRNALINYIPNINNIYDKKEGKLECKRRQKDINHACIYMYRENDNGYKMMTRFESQSNVCAESLIGECLGTKDGGRFGAEYELGTAETLQSLSSSINGTSRGINLLKP